ncbi:2-succinyl-5-enolpyruvyl-6-hydroxy-3-cyclohexene-1-carboxylic-acid synthase [Reichenbachiella agariperforans]|nr:2-succinyl-5-enolpyruvyl-6-hydroxy-3-cyclohexene-1-carboxylic-acid synthase [Reichenbachiella agariperforans]
MERNRNQVQNAAQHIRKPVMDLQSTFDIPELCHQYGVQHAVISPGSRNAALTIAFARHPEIQCYSVPDERSAAFIALGLSLKTHQPTVLICTSGSAGLNYAPAVAEAYFNQVPLLILTADRPADLIGKRDGQTIYQQSLYGSHAKAYFDFPSFDENLETAHTCIHQALQASTSDASGPVQVNVPFKEPFYPEQNKTYQATNGLQAVVQADSPSTWDKSRLNQLTHYSKILIIAGQGHKEEKLITTLNQLSTKHNIPVIADVISNCHEVAQAIQHQDLFLINRDPSLQPDLIISFGLSVISKNLKLFLRGCKNLTHWHITPNQDAADTYDHLSEVIAIDTLAFISEWLNTQQEAKAAQQQFFTEWQNANQSAQALISDINPRDWTETTIYKTLLEHIPAHTDLHLANSMAVRYANTLAVKNQLAIYCNRGTSGIDGSNSTAVGTCLASGTNTLLLTGDVAFLYDRNAFWHNHLPDNLRIVVFNNNGGGIFRMIDGPAAQPELKTFFETDQRSSASHVAHEFDFRYLTAHSWEDLDTSWDTFFDFSQGRILLEVFSDAEENKRAYKQLFKKMKDLSSRH